MRGRDTAFLIVGLLLGAVFGVLVSGTGLVNLSGTAAVTMPIRQAYFAFDVVELQSWLTAAYPDEADELLQAVTRIAVLSTADDFASAFAEVEPDVALVTERAFQSLTGIAADPAEAPTPVASPEPLMTSLAEGSVKACLGLDMNPYNSAGLAVIMAVELPETQLGQVPETWEAYRLETAKDEELFWQALDCRQLEGGNTERSR